MAEITMRPSECESRTVDVNGVLIHVQLNGPPAAPAMLMAHGLGNDLHLWDAQSQHFKNHFRVVRLDSYGHGKSTESLTSKLDLETLASHLLGVMDALQIEQSILIGTSMGAIIGLATVARAPQRFSKLVLCGARLHTRTEAVQEMRARTAQTAREGLAGVADVMMQRWFPPQGLPMRQAIIERVESTFRLTSPAAYAACAGAMVEYDLRPTLRALTIPVLLVAGELDDDIARQFELLADEPGSSLQAFTMKSVGHFPNLQDSMRFNSRLRDFLAGN